MLQLEICQEKYRNTDERDTQGSILLLGIINFNIPWRSFLILFTELKSVLSLPKHIRPIC
jgi:hypothetical protein